MAYLDFGTTSYSIAVAVEGLDSNYSASVRTLKYEIRKYGYSTVLKSSGIYTIPKNASSSITHVFTGLDSYTRYDLRAIIGNIIDSNQNPYSVNIDGNTRTRAESTPTPTPPTNLFITGITETSAILYFTPKWGTEFDVYLNFTFVGTAYSSPYNLKNLSPGTDYDVFIIAYDADGVRSGRSDYVSFTTPSPVPLPPTFNLGSATSSSFKVSYNLPNDANRADIYVGTSTSNYINKGRFSSSPVTIDGLLPNTRYYVKLRSYSTTTGYTSADSNAKYIDTLAETIAPPSFTLGNASLNGFTVTFTLPNNANRARMYIGTSSNNLVDQGLATSPTVVNWLAKGTLYYVALKSVNTSTGTESVITAAKSIATISIDSWKWTSTVASNSPFMITAGEWSDFTLFINGVRRAKGLGNYTFTTSATYIAQGKDFKAAYANEAVNAMNDMLATGKMATVTSGQTISAAFFNGMKDKLNSLI